MLLLFPSDEFSPVTRAPLLYNLSLLSTISLIRSRANRAKFSKSTLKHARIHSERERTQDQVPSIKRQTSLDRKGEERRVEYFGGTQQTKKKLSKSSADHVVCAVSQLLRSSSGDPLHLLTPLFANYESSLTSSSSLNVKDTRREAVGG